MTLAAPHLQHRRAVLLGNVAGYIGFRTVEIGLRHRLFERLAAHPAGIPVKELAADAGLDPFYLAVWCRSAFAAGVVGGGDGAYWLEPAVAALLVDRDSPDYVGGLFELFDKPEVFDRFSEAFDSGQRTWWNQFSAEFIAGVAETSRPAYIRLVPAGLASVPGLADVLYKEADVVDLGCGTGFGLTRLAKAYPSVRLVGVDGDNYSLELAAKSVAEAGCRDRVELVLSTLEDLDRRDAFDVAVINLSMHESRDLDRVANNVRRSLRPGGYFVISDFPFPDTTEGLRTIPGRIMAGIQFAEAQIDDQLLPTSVYLDLLERHGFGAVGSFDVTPTHAVAHGRTPS
jgi:SAM-dependent methyltransferase